MSSSAGAPLGGILGSVLVSRGGAGGALSEVSAASALSASAIDYVLLYFSASWCPPCQQFTPLLSAFFSASSSALKFAVVFVSSDRDDASFAAYFGKMPWALALPRASPLRGDLGRRFRVAGIPHLVVLRASDGALVSAVGRERLTAQPSGAGFPWAPRLVWDVLAGGALADAAGAPVAAAALRGGRRAVGLYFSAHWCPPCRAFTPELARWYNERGAAAGAEIVFVSSDEDAQSCDAYAAEMPWPRLRFADRDVKEELSQLFGVEGIPCLVFVDAQTGALITKEGRARVAADPGGFPWPPKPVEPLGLALADALNDLPHLVLFSDAMTDAAAEAAAAAALAAVAQDYFAAAGGKPADALRFAHATADDDATERVRAFIGGAHRKDKDAPAAARVTLLDIPNGKKYAFNGGALGVPTADELRAFAKAFLDGTAVGGPLKG